MISRRHAWGRIHGTLSDQADLQAALDGKQATLPSGNDGQVLTLVSGSWAAADAAGGGGVVGSPIRINPYVYQSSTITPTLVVGSYYALGQIVRVSLALNDETSYKVALGAGNYELYVIGQTGNSPIMSYYLGSNLLGTIDFYSGSTYNNVQLQLSGGFTVGTSGLYDFKTKATGLNASASGYYNWVNEIVLVQTS